MSEGEDAGGADQIATSWMRLRETPMAMIAAALGRSVKALWSEATGLSPAHVATRGLRVAHAARELDVERHALARAREKLARAGLSAPHIEDRLARRPRTPWAAYVFDIADGSGPALPLAQACASALDDLTERAIDRLARNDLDGYRALLEAASRHDIDLAAAAVDADFQSAMQALSSAADWPALLAPTRQIIDFQFLRLLAALDVEWGAHYLGSLVPTPTLPWLFPRFHPEFDETNSKGLKRDVVVRPIRSLLQLMWTMLRRRANAGRRWPDGFPGASELARDLSDESTTDAAVRKMFSGGRRLTIEEVAGLWAGLSRSLVPGEDIVAPWLWIFIGLVLERRFVENVPGSTRAATIAIPSEAGYRALWESVRQRWSDQLPAAGERPWPAWLLAQSSSPPWLRSSQSSGRSSSPPDCQ